VIRLDCDVGTIEDKIFGVVRAAERVENDLGVLSVDAGLRVVRPRDGAGAVRDTAWELRPC
jgi:hypothetical protein